MEADKKMNIFTRIIIVCLLSVVQTAYAGMDDKTLKEYLSRNFTAEEGMPWEKIEGFKASRAIPEDQLHRTLMEIFKEASEKRNSLTPKTRQWYDNRHTIEGVLGWLPACGDIPVKDFLMNYAVAKENDSLNRSYAVLSYLRIADAEETKNALLRFLIEVDRMDSMARLGLYGHARTAYDAASPEKKAAILAALIAAANKEEGKIEFMKVDKILAERSAAYRHSRERLAMLERHSLEPPTNNLYTDRDLKAGLEECRTYKAHTSINTNLAVLKTRNFNLPLLAGATNELTDSDPASPEVDFVKVGDDSKDPVTMEVLVTVLLLAIFGFSVWKARKGKHQ